MAVANSLAKTQAKSDVIKYNANGEEVKLSKSLIKNYLVSGNKDAVTDQEVTMFLSMCKFQHLNPFLREAYLIKYGSNNPATMVVGKDVLLKRAMRSDKFDGLSAGVIVINNDGKLEEREGTFVLDNETLVGGWARVNIKGYSVPIYASVSLKEYMGRKSDGSPNGQWSNKPATMIRKVALAQALREAFPEEMSALYEQEEIKELSDVQLDTTPVPMPTENTVETPVQVVEAEKVITPVQSVAKPSEPTQGGQTAIDDIMFNDNVADLVGNQPPFEI